MPPEIDTTPIPMSEVESSRIFAAGYNPETKTLALRFRRVDGALAPEQAAA